MDGLAVIFSQEVRCVLEAHTFLQTMWLLKPRKYFVGGLCRDLHPGCPQEQQQFFHPLPPKAVKIHNLCKSMLRNILFPVTHTALLGFDLQAT